MPPAKTPTKRAMPVKRPTQKRDGFREDVNYIAAVKKKIYRAANKPMYPKILIYAGKKKGKTTLALTAGKPGEILILDPEEGALYKRKTNPYIYPVERWEDMQEIYGALRTGRLSPAILELGPETDPFKWVVPDGLTRINNMALKFVMHQQEERNLDRIPNMVDRRDYNKSGELMKDLLTQFHTLRMGVIYTAQERIKAVGGGDDEDVDVESTEVLTVPDLPDGVRGAVNSLVDVIGRLYVVRIEDKDGNKVPVRRLHLGVHERYDTGGRSEFKLPEMMKNPTVPKLVAMMEGDGVNGLPR